MPESTMPAVSVIVPVYNIERYLPECLDSLISQTHTDFEIVVVDDGSTDGCAAIIDTYATKFPTLVRPFSKSNGGLADARNFGMSHARGAYVLFVDGDDVVTPDMIARMHDRALDSNADLVVCGIENFVDGEPIGTFYPEPDMSVFGHSLAEQPRLLYRVDASACNKLYARDLFERSGVEFPVGMRFEDVPTTYRLLPFARNVEKIDAPLYRYRKHRAGSISSNYGTGYRDLVEGFRLIDVAYAETGIFESNRDSLLRLHLTHLVAGRYPDLYLHASSSDRRRFITEAFGLLDVWFTGWRGAGVCRELWKHPVLRFVSTHAGPLMLFASLPRRFYVGTLARLGAFDPSR